MTGFDHALSNSTINGVGITMEGIWTNYPIFEMTLQSAYAAQVSGATLGEWWESYGTRRYGQQSQIITSHPFFKMAQHLDLRCVLLSIRPRQVPYHEPTDNGCWLMIGHLSWAYMIPAPLVPGVPTKTCLESRFCTKKFNPHLMCDCRPCLDRGGRGGVAVAGFYRVQWRRRRFWECHHKHPVHALASTTPTKGAARF